MTKPHAKPAMLSRAIALALLGTVPVSATQAADRYWVCGSTYWDSTSDCWSATPGGTGAYRQPLSGDNAFLTSDDGLNRSINYSNLAYPGATLGSLLIDATGGGTMTLSYYLDYNLNTLNEIIGDAGSGRLVQSNGTHSVADELILGNKASGYGKLDVSHSATLVTGDLHAGYFGAGDMNIHSGGSVSSTNAGIGFATGGTGTVTVDGDGSTWDVSNDLRVGYHGDGDLTIRNGGSVTSVGGTVGGTAGTATVIVDGPGSSWTSTDSLRLGLYSDGSLTIRNGGSVSSTTGHLGIERSGSDAGSGVATVDGAGSSWSNSGALYVGETGNGSLNILNGGEVSNTDAYISKGPRGNGSVTVDGAGSSWSNSGALRVGVASTGELAIRNGGTVTSNDGYLGVNVDRDGRATVEGAGSRWDNSDQLYVGDSGYGELTIRNGGRVTTGYRANIGYADGGSGFVLVDGAGSSWEAGTNFVGYNGTGSFTVQNGAVASGNSAFLGYMSGDGAVIVDGAGSTWTNRSVLHVGFNSTGALTVSNGGSVSSADAHLGSHDRTAVGSVLVDGAGSALSSDVLHVGEEGSGTLVIRDGGAVSSLTGIVSEGYSSDGSVTVAGAGSTWTNQGYLTVGSVGTGTLSIRQGGRVSSANGYIGSSGQGDVSVNGAGSSWNNNNVLRVANHGTATLDIRNGASVSNVTGYVGYSDSGSGTVTVDGAGSLWYSSGDLFLGGSDTAAGGSASLTVQNGGEVAVGGTLKLWGAGTVNLNGGTISTDTLVSGDGFNFNAGRLSIGSDLELGSGGALGNALTLNGLHSLEVGGTTRLAGYSTLTLDGGSFSTGALVDNGGFSFERGTFSLTGSDLHIGSGGLFGSFVQFNGDQTVNVYNNATVDAGAVLALNNGRFGAGTIMNHGRIVMDGMVAALNGGVLNNAGTLAGSGQVGAALNNGPGGEVRLDDGATLTFTGAGNSNAGRISLLGGTADFTRGLTNASGGQISGHGTLVTGDGSALQLQDGSDLVVSGDKTYTGDGSLVDGDVASAGGLTNEGALALSGNSDIIGDVDNSGDGTIVVSGGATATFHDDVVHNGAEIRVSEGSRAVIFGAATGAGAYTGSGTVHFEGDLLPGNSPALVEVEGDMVLTTASDSARIFEIGGTKRGLEYDAYDVGGSLTLGGALAVEWYDLGDGDGLFTAAAGNSFDLFQAESISGSFDSLSLASLGAGLEWEYNLLTDAFGSTDILRMSVVSTSAVPVPAAVWLFGSGLLGLVGVARRRRA